MKYFEDIPESPAPKAGWKEGDLVPPDLNNGLKIDKAKIVTNSTIYEMALNKERVDNNLIFIRHPSRPFLTWVILPLKNNLDS